MLYVNFFKFCGDGSEEKSKMGQEFESFSLVAVKVIPIREVN